MFSKLSIILLSTFISGCSMIDFDKLEEKAYMLGVDEEDKKAGIDYETLKEMPKGFSKKDPRFYLSEAAKIAEERGSYFEAAGYWRKILKDHPSHTEAIYGFSRTGRKSGIGKPVLSVLFNALSKEPSDGNILAEIAKTYFSMGQYNQALQNINQAIMSNPNKWEYLSLLGVIYDKKQDFLKASRAYEEAISLSENNSTILNNYAVSRLLAGDIENAERYSYDAIYAPNAKISSFKTYAKILAKQGRFKEAKKILEQNLDEYTADLLYQSVRKETASPVLWGRSN